jgi:predicted RNA-binding protein YlqC (UPF0109 family)
MLIAAWMGARSGDLELLGATGRERLRELIRTRTEWEGGTMKELIEYIAKALVDFPDQVSVNVLEGTQATVLELNVAKADLGKVIGKQGRTAKAIRTILGAASAKEKKRAVLEIVE